VQSYKITIFSDDPNLSLSDQGEAIFTVANYKNRSSNRDRPVMSMMIRNITIKLYIYKYISITYRL